jgi:hypothetical protein
MPETSVVRKIINGNHSQEDPSLDGKMMSGVTLSRMELLSGQNMSKITQMEGYC